MIYHGQKPILGWHMRLAMNHIRDGALLPWLIIALTLCTAIEAARLRPMSTLLFALSVWLVSKARQ